MTPYEIGIVLGLIVSSIWVVGIYFLMCMKAMNSGTGNIILIVIWPLTILYILLVLMVFMILKLFNRLVGKND